MTISTRLGAGGIYGAKSPQSWEHRMESWIWPASTPGTKSEMDHRASHIAQSWGTDRCHRVKLGRRVRKRQTVRKQKDGDEVGPVGRSGFDAVSPISATTSLQLRGWSACLAKIASSWTYLSSRAESQESFIVRVRNKPGFEPQLLQP